MSEKVEHANISVVRPQRTGYGLEEFSKEELINYTKALETASEKLELQVLVMIDTNTQLLSLYQTSSFKEIMYAKSLLLFLAGSAIYLYPSFSGQTIGVFDTILSVVCMAASAFIAFIASKTTAAKVQQIMLSHVSDLVRREVDFITDSGVRSVSKAMK